MCDFSLHFSEIVIAMVDGFEMVRPDMREKIVRRERVWAQEIEKMPTLRSTH
jgi:hypothetical protein